MSLKDKLKNIYALIKGLDYFFRFKPIKAIKQYLWYFRNLNLFKKCNKNPNFCKISFYPCLMDNLSYTPVDAVYFYQDCWAAKHIFRLKPKHHYDVGSHIKTIGIISQFVPVTMIDIRPPDIELPNLFFKKGSILELPFEDNSLESLSSLCVVEHIGLGRYRDTLDQYGSEKALKELHRVLKLEGILLFSIPVDRENKIYYNAHRSFTREYLIELFSGFEILEEKYIYGNRMYDFYDKSKGFGTGLYMLKKKG